MAGSPMGCSISICGDPLGATGNTDGGGPGGGSSAAGVDAAGLAPFPVPASWVPTMAPAATSAADAVATAATIRARRRRCRAGAAAGMSPAVCPGCPERCKRAPVGGRRRERHLRAERRLVPVRAGAAAWPRRRRWWCPRRRRGRSPMGAAAGGLGGIAVGRGADGLPGAVLVLADDGHRRGGQVGVRRARPGRGWRRTGPSWPSSAAEVGRWRGLRARQAVTMPVQFRGQPGQVGRLGRELDQHVHDRLPLVGGVPGGGEGQRRAEREHVARHRGLPGVPCLLGRHVGGRAHGPAGDGELDALGGPGHPEVDHPGPVRRDKHVGRLQVPVHQPGAVDRLQRLRAPGREPSGRRDRQRAALGHQLAQRGCGHVGRGQPRHVRLGVGRDDRRREHAADPPGRGHLVREPGAEPRLVGELDLDGLDRDQAPGRGPSQVHPAHRPRPEAAEQHVRPDPLRVPAAQRLQRRLRHVITFPGGGARSL